MHKENSSHQDFYASLIRLHILHHACEGEVFGLWLIEELGRHGYKLSPGTMYLCSTRSKSVAFSVWSGQAG